MSAESGTLALSPFRHPGEAFAAVRLGLHVACRAARDPEELSLHHEIRRRVFVEEQGLFDSSDGDDHDDDPATVRILGLCGDIAGFFEEAVHAMGNQLRNPAHIGRDRRNPERHRLE